MNSYFSKLVCVAFILLVIQSLATHTSASQSPNVVLIITDDQGYGDFSCHGNPVLKTPHMDRLHHQSVRFTDFHVDPTCAPTRAALITGKYSHRAGVWHTVSGGNHLRATETTIANVFKDAGYRTGLFGKWHLGSNYPYRPMDRGFDEWFGQGDGGTGTTDDWFDNDRVNDHYWHNGQRVQRDGYAPDLFFDEAIRFIKQTEYSPPPFFVYIATYLPHNPHTIPDRSWIEKYSDKIPDHIAYFFAGIERVDWNLGRLRKALAESGQADNTIVIFMTDNGGTAGVKLFNAGMRGNKGQVYEGGHRVPLFVHWPHGNLKHGSDVTDLTAHIDVLPSLIDLCDLPSKNKIDFDGRSFKQQLYDPVLKLPQRTLFVETQRTYQPQTWIKTVGMTNQWRLVDNKELYDLSKDPAQKLNLYDQCPEVVSNIQAAHQDYWARVTPKDRDRPRFIVGHPQDPETFLTTSDWYLPTPPPWNHAQVAAGNPAVGTWDITIAQAGIYRFEVRRWPREAQASIQGIPNLKKTVDAWTKNGGVEKLIYGNKMKALPVHAITLEVGEYNKKQAVHAGTKRLIFDVALKPGDTQVKATMLDQEGKVLAGAYYIYVTRL